MGGLSTLMEVHHHWFDWILFAILGIPLVLGLIQLITPNWLEPLIIKRQ